MTEHKPAEINQDALRAALNWALDEIDVLSNKLVQFGYPQGILMLDREDQAEGYWNACDARRALDEWRCPKCGVQADERWNCCEVHPEAALPQEGAAVAAVCGACGQPWTGQKCGQADNGRPHEVCFPVAPSPAVGVDAVQVAVLAEREACAKFVEDWQRPTRQDLPCCECGNVDRQDAQETFAAAIRARPLPCP